MSAMASMLKPQNVQVVDSCNGWEDAVHVAVRPLVDGGYVTPAYVDAIIKNANKLGPYFVLAPDLALLHARPDQGVVSQQLAVTILRQGVEFKPGEPVRVLVTLAATDQDSHLDVMRTLAAMFSDPANIKKCATAASAADVYNLFQRPRASHLPA